MKPQTPLFLALLLSSGLALAQSTEAEFETLARAYKFNEVETLARERLRANPRDDVALWAWGRSAGGEAKQREELLPRAEACVNEQPQSAHCHNLLGSLYGSQAMQGGMSDGIKLAGRIKDSFLKAVALNPRHYDLRRDLIQFYLQAPGIVGGSVRKAREQAAEFAAIDAQRALLLRADVHLYEEEFAQAEALLAGVKPGADADLARDLRNGLTSLGFALMHDKQFDKARKQFERVLAEDNTLAFAHFGLGRTLLEQRQFDPAIAALERALQLNPKQPAQYRLGLAYQGKGEKAKAVGAYKQFLAIQGTGKQADDARKRLAELG